MKIYLKYAVLGTIMGFVLASIGMANYDEVHKMFVFQDFRMLFTFMGAVGIVALAALVFRKHFPRQEKIFQPGLIPGSMTFGFGWAITGACPSLVFVQLGQGYIPAVMTLVGVYLGVFFYKKAHARFFTWSVGQCNSA